MNPDEVYSELVDVAAQLRNFHNREYEAQRKSIHEVWALPLATRVKKGKAIAKVELVAYEPEIPEETRKWVTNHLTSFGIEATAEKVRDWVVSSYKTSLEPSIPVAVKAAVNQANFKAGSYVVLHRGDPFDEENAYPLSVERENGEILTLDAQNGRDPSARIPSKGWILDAYQPDMRWIFEKALDQLPNASNNTALIDILVRKALPAFNSKERATARKLVTSMGLNERQQEAFVNAYAAENYYLVQGPPGTGKTWVLAHLAVAFARAGKRVLITSSNHRGINNALHKIWQATGYQHLLKISKAEQADGLGEVRRRSHCPPLAPIDGQEYIVGGTAQSLCTSRLANVRFDVVIADEASQINLVQATAAMLVAPKYIFIGDHQQMPPIIAAEHPNFEHRKSIFEYLFDIAPGTMLDTTYRMNAAIAEFSSSRFYDGKLRPHSSAATRTLHLTTPAVQYADVFDPNEPSVFVDLRHANTNTQEPSEAHYIADMIAELLACGVPAHEIAVVAPYRAQGRAIRKQLDMRCADLAPQELVKITIDTVERMQGQERNVVFLSLTSGTFDAALQRASFYFMPNRLNVAITRARVKRIVVGSSRLTDGVFESPDLQKWTSTFRDFLGSCHCITRLKPLKKNPPASV